MQTETAQTAAPVDRSTNLAEFQARYGGQYVALDGDQVVASSARLDVLLEHVDSLGERAESLAIEYIEPADIFCAY